MRRWKRAARTGAIMLGAVLSLSVAGLVNWCAWRTEFHPMLIPMGLYGSALAAAVGFLTFTYRDELPRSVGRIGQAVSAAGCAVGTVTLVWQLVYGWVWLLT